MEINKENIADLVAALNAPSFQQDSQWHHPKVNYATKPRDLLTDAATTISVLYEALIRSQEQVRSLVDDAQPIYSGKHPVPVLDIKGAANILEGVGDLISSIADSLND